MPRPDPDDPVPRPGDTEREPPASKPGVIGDPPPPTPEGERPLRDPLAPGKPLQA